MPAVTLNDRSLFHVAGADAENFLHNLVTTDIQGLPSGEARPGALLTPQGKILFDFHIWRSDDGFTIECDTSAVDALIKRLTMYKLRAAVTISPAAPGITIFWGDEAARPDGVCDYAFLRAGLDVKRKPGAEGPDSAELYDGLRIEAALVQAGRDYALQDAFPHDILLDLNGGLSFRKGCYVGQEVVSRMQHRGTARRRVVQVSAETPLPESGTELSASGKPVGTLGTVQGTTGLAIVRIDRVGDALANGVEVLAGSQPVILALPLWTGLTFPTTAAEADA